MSSQQAKRKLGDGQQPAGKKQKYNPLMKKKDKKKVVLLSREDRKRLAKERKASKPNYEVVSELNSLWSTSLTSLPGDKRAARIDELLASCKGKIQATAVRHDASRVFQMLIKHGSHAQRAKVMEELKGRLVDLATNKYGHFVVLKMLQFGNKTTKDAILDEFTTKGARSVERLAFHLDAAKVLDFAYASASAARREAVLLHFYGAEFALFGQAAPEGEGSLLGRLLAAHPEKRADVLSSIERAVQKAVNKEMLMFRFVHTLVRQYVEHADPAQGRELSSQMFGHVVDLYHSEDGARVLMHCLEQGTPKERKQILKSLKEVVHAAATDPHGFMVVLRALDVVDDTVLLRKQVLQPLFEEDLLEVALSQHGSLVLLHMLAPRDQRFMHPRLIARLTTPVRRQTGEDGKVVEVQTSRKDPATRRAELLAVARPALLECVAENATAMVRSRAGSRVLVEALREAAADGKPLDGEPRRAMKAVARTVAKTEEEEKAEAAEREGVQHQAFGGGDKGADERKTPLDPKKAEILAKIAAKKRPWMPVLEDPHAHYVIRHALEAVRDVEEAASYMGKQLASVLEEAGQETLGELAATNRPAFVMAALLQTLPVADREEFACQLRPHVAAMRDADRAGPTVLADLLEGKEPAPRPAAAAAAKKGGKKTKASAKKRKAGSEAEEEPPATPARKKRAEAATPLRRSTRKRTRANPDM